MALLVLLNDDLALRLVFLCQLHIANRVLLPEFADTTYLSLLQFKGTLQGLDGLIVLLGQFIE